jgi:hypothetical protein
MTKIAGSGSGSYSQRHGSADPYPLQNVMDLQHWEVVTRVGVVQPGGEEGGVHGLRHQVVPVQQILPVQGGRQLQVILRTKMNIISITLFLRRIGINSEAEGCGWEAGPTFEGVYIVGGRICESGISS